MKNVHADKLSSKTPATAFHMTVSSVIKCAEADVKLEHKPGGMNTAVTLMPCQMRD
jgi:hypothetical protein